MKSTYKNILCQAILTFSIFILSFNANAANTAWRGTSSSAWSTTGNWSAGVPGASDTAVFNTSVANNPVMDGNKTIYRLVMQTDTLDLNGYTLTASGSSVLSGGRITNGTIDVRGSSVTFSGSVVDVTVSAAASAIYFNGTTFNYPVAANITGTSTNTSNGGCTFKSTFSIFNSGGATINFANSSKDIYEGDVTLTDTLSGCINMAIYDTSVFKENIYVNAFSTSGGITFGSGAWGLAKLLSGKTISAGSSGFAGGTLVLGGFLQSGTTVQSITLTGSAVISLINANFGGALTCSSPGVLIKNSTFSGAVILTKTDAVSNSWYGGNTFSGKFRLTNSGSGTIALQSSSADVFSDSATFNAGSGTIRGNISGTTVFSSDLYTTGTNFDFKSGSGTYKFTGSSNQIIKGTVELKFTGLTVDKSSGTLTLQAPVLINTMLKMTSGVILTDTTNIITLSNGSSHSESSSASYIDGPMKKIGIGITSFCFPVGKSNEFNPISITAPTSATDAYVAEYFNTGQIVGDSMVDSLKHIFDCFYWGLKQTSGSTNVYATLGWDTAYCMMFDTSLLRVGKWDGARWIDLGHGIFTGDYSGNLTSALSSNHVYYVTFAYPMPMIGASLSLTIDHDVDHFYGISGKDIFKNFNHDWEFVENDNGDAIQTTLIKNVQGLYPGILRFNAGGPGNYFDWHKGWFFDDAHLLKYNQILKDECYSFNDQGQLFDPTDPYDHYDARLAQFKNALDYTGAIPLFEFNISSSDIDFQLALLVEARKLNIPILNVELGTELYISGQDGLYELAFANGTEYGTKCYEWTRRIKEAFGEDVKVGVCISDRFDNSYSRRNDWNKLLLAELKAREDLSGNLDGPDAVILHQYIHEVNQNGPTHIGEPISEFDRMFRAAYKRVTTTTPSETCIMDGMILKIDDFYPGRDYDIWFTEYGLDEEHYLVHGTWASGLFTALQTLLYLEDENITMAVDFTLWSNCIWGNIFVDEFSFADNGDKTSRHQYPFPSPDDPSLVLSGKDEYSAFGHAMRHIGKAFMNATHVTKIDFTDNMPFIDEPPIPLNPLFPGLYGYYFSDGTTLTSGKELIIINVSNVEKLTINLTNLLPGNWTNYSITSGVPGEFVVGDDGYYFDLIGQLNLDDDATVSNIPLGSINKFIIIPSYSIVRVYSCKVPPLTVTASANAICSGETVTLNLVTPLEDGWTFEWDDGGTEETYRFVSPPVNSSCSPELYNYTITVTDNCASTSSSSVNVSVMPEVNVEVTADPTGDLCPGTSVLLTASQTLSSCSLTDIYEWITSDGDGIWQYNNGQINNSQIIVDPSQTTEYTAYALYSFTSPSMQCAASNSVTVTIEPPPLNLPPDTVICAANPVIDINLVQYNNTDYTFEWVIDDDPLTPTNDPHFLNLYEFSTTDRMLHTVTLTVTHDASQCSVYQEMIVRTVDCCTGNCTVNGSQSTLEFIDWLGDYPAEVTISYDGDVAVVEPTGGSMDVALNCKIKFDLPIRFQRCQFLMGEAAEIEILNHSSLSVQSTQFNACTSYQWKGITVNTGANLSTGIYTDKNVDPPVSYGRSEINEAQYAVFAKNLSGIDLSGTDFNDNYVGLEIPYNTNPKDMGFNTIFSTLRALNFRNPNTLKDLYIGQSPVPAGKTYAGMELHNVAINLDMVGNDVEYNKTIFDNLSNGILAYNCALSIGNCEFTDIQPEPTYDTYLNGMGGNGSGIYMEDFLSSLPKTIQPTAGAEVYFDDCYTGITCNRAGAAINFATMDNVSTGIRLSAALPMQENWIGANTINASVFGIDASLNDAASIIYIHDNTITIDNPGVEPLTCGIFVDEVNLGQFAPYYHMWISRNNINVNQAFYGILAKGVRTLKIEQHEDDGITDNSIKLNNDGTNLAGISLVACNNVDVEENEIYGSSTDEFSGQVGIDSWSTTDATYCTNKTFDTEYGFSFHSSELGTDFMHNEMQNHWIGLNLDANAVIGKQKHQGNEWGGSCGFLSGTCARHQSNVPSFVSQSEFEVGTGPYFPVAIPSGWFTNTFGSENDCHPIQAFNVLDSLIIADSIDFPIYKEATNWQADEYTYNKLQDNPGLISEEYIEDFVVALSGSNIEYFRQITDTLKSSFRFDSSSYSSIRLNDSLIAELMVNKYLNDSLIDTLGIYVNNINLYEENRGIINQISALQKTNSLIIMTLDSLRIQKINDAIAINSGLSSAKIYEQNQIGFFRIYLNWLSNHRYSFTSGEIDTLYNIAVQCPLAGGKAVYYARNLYRLIADTLVYDDISACGEAEERIGRINSTNNDITILPNPTTDYFDVLINQGDEETYSYILSDETGRSCENEFNLKGNFKRINTSSLTQGIYNLKVIYGDEKIANKMVVIIR